MTGADEQRVEGEPFVLTLFRVVVAREGGQPSARVLEVEGDVIHVGSHPSNDVVLHDARVAPFHCSLARVENGLRLTDSGSQHGTWVSGLRVRDVDLPRTEAQVAVGSSLLAISTLAASKAPELHPESQLGRLVGASPGMRRLFAILQRESASTAPLLVEGETGSGRTLVAQEVVRLGARQGRPFLTVNCRAFASGPHENDSAERVERAQEPGPLQRAFTLSSGGTLLLENVEELPPTLQEQLLRFLEAQAGGGPTPLRADDVRIVATSSGSLRRAVNRGLFLEDLYFRLTQATALRIPPLRERVEDVPLLIQAFLAIEHPDARSWRFTSDALQDLRRREWPGNVRELFEYVTRALGLDHAEGSLERPRAEPRGSSDAPEGPPSVVEEPFKVRKERLIESFEREYLRELMTWASGNVSRAARKARIDRMYLHRLLVRHGIERRQSPEH